MENVIVRKMIKSLDISAKKGETEKRDENYNKQVMLYRKLISEEGGNERETVCARCLLSLSRSLFLGKHSEDSLNSAKNEISFLCKTIEEKNTYSGEIKEIISERIKSLSQRESDELVDSVLFVYHSLLNGGETA